MKEKIDICAGVSLLLGFIICICGLIQTNEFVFGFALFVYLIIAVTYIIVEACIYLDFKNDNLQDIIEDDIDTFEDARKEVEKLEDLLKK